MIVDTSKYLPEYVEGEEDTARSCIGGAVFFAKRGRIVVSSTIEDKLKLVFEEAIPQIRHTLFPNFRK